MRGLFEKDVRLTTQRGKLLLLFIVVMLIMGISTEGNFIVSYGTILFGIITVGTTCYDELDNCFPFLLTLPVTRKDYVREKFLFCGGGALVGWAVSMIFCAAVAVYRGNIGMMAGSWAEELLLWPVFCAIIMVMIPVQLKYGVEKSRIVLLILGGAILGAAAVGSNFMKGKDISVFRVIRELPEPLMTSGIVVISVCVIVAMYRWSVRVMERKVF